MRACASVLTVKHDVIDDLSVTSASVKSLGGGATKFNGAALIFVDF
jgi:hypothetical protein